VLLTSQAKVKAPDAQLFRDVVGKREGNVLDAMLSTQNEEDL